MAAGSDQQPLQNDVAATGVRTTPLPNEPLPEKKRCTGYHFYKAFSIVYAILFVLIGLLLTAIAVWIIVIKQEFESIGDIVYAPVILALIVGVIIIATAIIGCIGASCDKLWPLRVFLGIVIVVFILQIVIGILAYVYREETIEKFGDRLHFALKNYNDNEDVQRAVDKVQKKWQCCGIEKPEDWNQNRFYDCSQGQLPWKCSVPDSCCVTLTEGCGRDARKTASQRINQQGCRLSFQKWVEKHLDAIGATALTLAILHILGIFMVYMFITKVEDRIRLFKYRKRYYDNN